MPPRTPQAPPGYRTQWRLWGCENSVSMLLLRAYLRSRVRTGYKRCGEQRVVLVSRRICQVTHRISLRAGGPNACLGQQPTILVENSVCRSSALKQPSDRSYSIRCMPRFSAHNRSSIIPGRRCHRRLVIGGYTERFKNSGMRNIFEQEYRAEQSCHIVRAFLPLGRNMLAIRLSH